MNDKDKKYDKKCPANTSRRNGRKDGKVAGQGDRRNQSSERETRRTKGDNDISWYSRNPQLLADAASINFSWPLGNLVDFGVPSRYLAEAHYESVPGICDLRVNICPGISDSSVDAVNVAATRIYSYVRHANSGHTNYEAPDLMMYLLAMDSIYSCFAWAARVYGVTNTASVANKYLPRGILTAMGVDVDDVINNLANFRYGLNQLVVKMSGMAVPGNLPLFERHFWLFSHLYTDNPNAKSQIYMMNPYDYFIMEPVKYDTGTALVSYPFYKDGNGGVKMWKTQEIINLLNRMIDAVILNEDMNIMSGDILKAYGEGALIRPAVIPSDYSVLPEFNPEVLLQISNATSTGEVNRTLTEGQFNRADVYQENGKIKYHPIFKSTVPVDVIPKAILNMPVDQTTPALNMVASRLTTMPRSRYELSGEYMQDFHALGSDYCVGFQLWSRTSGSQTYEPIYRSLFNFGMMGTDMYIDNSDYAVYGPYLYAALAAFGSHPMVTIWGQVGTFNGESMSYQTYWGGPMCDMQNAAFLVEHDLAKMHNCAIFSEYDVPEFGNWNK